MESENTKVVKSKRIFINDVDLYHSNYIGQFLSTCLVGAALKDGEEDEAEEELEEEMNEIGVVGPDSQKSREGYYQIVGTLSNPQSKSSAPSYVEKIFNLNNIEDYERIVEECDIIVFNINDSPAQLDSAELMLTYLHDNVIDRQSASETTAAQKHFVLLSNVMTWARTRPLDTNDPDIPFNEEDYRRRKAHQNFTRALDIEKMVISEGNIDKTKLISHVICSGLTYGCGEDIFFHFFKTAWQSYQQVELFGNGQNIIPTIHIKDLARVLQNILDIRPKTRYLLATDSSKNTLEEIIRSIATNLSNGKVKVITKEEALLNKDIEQTNFDRLMINLNMEPVFIKESMQIRWTAEAGLVENIFSIIREFKINRNLIPLRVCILGPPASGKTCVVRQLSEKYKVPMVNLKELIDETLVKLEKSAMKTDVDEGEEEGGEDGEQDEKAQEDAERLEAIKDARTDNKDRIPDEFIKSFYKDRLLSKACKNQGFILDNYPKTKAQAEELFSGDDEDEGEDEEENIDIPIPMVNPEGSQPSEQTPTSDDSISYNKHLIPSIVIVLDADDDILRQRVMHLPEVQVAGTHNTEEGFQRRIVAYRENNNEEDTVLNYFEDNKVPIVHIDTSRVFSGEDPLTINEISEEVYKVLGKPKNFSPTREEIAAEKFRLETLAQKEEEAKSAEDLKRKNEEISERENRRQFWLKQKQDEEKEEQAKLEENSLPLRNYLMQHVMPVLTKGLLETVKQRPNDAIDFLAEYLFRNNPQVE